MRYTYSSGSVFFPCSYFQANGWSTGNARSTWPIGRLIGALKVGVTRDLREINKRGWEGVAILGKSFVSLKEPILQFFFRRGAGGRQEGGNGRKIGAIKIRII